MAKTKLEIIQETVEFYSADVSRRAYVNGNCCYITRDGRMCAVGRCVEHPETIRSNTSVLHVFDSLKFKEEYHGHEPQFWKRLQRLHDNFGNWDENGLTSKGKNNVQLMIEEFSSQ